jgi:hypothetical protein
MQEARVTEDESRRIGFVNTRKSCAIQAALQWQMNEAHWTEHRLVRPKHGLLLEEPSHARSVRQQQIHFEGRSSQFEWDLRP